MFQNLGDDRVRDVLLALSVGAMFLYGFYIMKKVGLCLKIYLIFTMKIVKVFII